MKTATPVASDPIEKSLETGIRDRTGTTAFSSDPKKGAGATSVPAPNDAVAPTEPPVTAVRNVFELAYDYGIQFG